MSHSRKEFGVLAILLVATALLYANSLRNPFVVDDQHIIVRNLLLRQWTLRDILSSHLFAPLGVETQYYRPLTLLTFAINYGFSGLDPQGYHIVNLALHLLVITLSYLLFIQLVSPWIAGFSAGLFAVHPANVQAVSYLSSRSEPLYTALALFSMLFWVIGHGAKGNRRTLYRILSLISFFLSLFAKESAIVIPALVILTDWIWSNDRTWKQKFNRLWMWYLGFGAVLGIYIMIRTGVAGYALSMEASKEAWKTGTELATWPRMLLALKLLGLYLGLVLYPLNLSFFRDISIPEGPLDVAVLLGIASVGAMALLACLFWSQRREISYGIFWFSASILPVLNLTVLNAPMMEHWLYLPLIGFAFAFVNCLYYLANRLGEIRGAAFGCTLLIILLSARTVSRNAEWGNPVTLFLNDTRRYPNQEKNWFLLGYAYFERGMADQATRAYKAGLAVNPNHAYAWSGLGEVLSAAGKDEEAERSLMKAISIMPENPWLHYVLGIHRLKTGKLESAIEALSQSVSLKAPIPMAYHVLGSAYLAEGKKDEAEKAFQKALLMLPRGSEIHAAVHVELGKLYLNHGDKNKALEEWKIALRFDPNDAEAKALLAEQRETKQTAP